MNNSRVIYSAQRILKKLVERPELARHFVKKGSSGGNGGTMMDHRADRKMIFGGDLLAAAQSTMMVN
jgi:hypothetical protein